MNRTLFALGTIGLGLLGCQPEFNNPHFFTAVDRLPPDTQAEETQAPEGFVDLKKIIPDLILDLRYHGTNNFVGERIDGYPAPTCWMTQEAAVQLAAVQETLRPAGLSLKVFDAYRPQAAVDHFCRWVHDPETTRTKPWFYPRIPKNELIQRGYIADRSGHSRGSTVDLTLVARGSKVEEAPTELDMGTPFDFFGPESWTAHPDLTTQQRSNRLLLKTVMEKHGFVGYSKEWWHFRLKNEPFPETYFNFPTDAQP